jgi:isoleucyl-tRNA synthetase
MGYWLDLDHPYVTFENYYIETLWWLLKKFYEKGYLYEGYTIQPYRRGRYRIEHARIEPAGYIPSHP